VLHSGAWNLTDKQWAVLEPIFRPRRRLDGQGRPWTAPRAALNGALWVLRTGAPWHDLPRRYPPYQTCHRRFQLWRRSGRLEVLLIYEMTSSAEPRSGRAPLAGALGKGEDPREGPAQNEPAGGRGHVAGVEHRAVAPEHLLDAVAPSPIAPYNVSRLSFTTSYSAVVSGR
jgi:transposase